MEMHEALLESARDYCGDDVPVEAVLDSTGWPLPHSRWYEAVNAWCDANGRPRRHQWQPQTPRSAVERLATKLWAGRMAECRFVARIFAAAKVGKFDCDEAAEWLVRALAGQGWKPDEVAELAPADLAAIVGAGAAPVSREKPTSAKRGGRPPRWEGLLKLADELKASEPGITDQQVCTRWRQRNPKRASELPPDTPNARTLQNARAARLKLAQRHDAPEGGRP